MTGSALACTDRAVDHSLGLEIGVALVIDAGLVPHVDNRRATGGSKQRNDKNSKSTMHDSARPIIDEKPSALAILCAAGNS